jgi:2-methylcitrate dehydratase PrpD
MKHTSASSNTLADQLAAHFKKFEYGHLTEATKKSVKRLLLDYLGVAISGSQSESGQVARKFAAVTGGHAESTLIGGDARVPAMQAAFANAISSHSIELDDIDVLALFHFSPPVYSSALATAEQVGASGKDLLTALAAGCEMMERLSKAANSSLRNRGFHTTPTTGVFGATIAAAKLQGLSAEQMVSALGMAGASASGLMEMYGPSMQKRFNPGPAARNGVTAATMAGLGFTGAATIFEVKPYSCARPIHNAIDCALEIRRKHAPDLKRIKAIEMARHSDWALYHQNKRPQTYHEAQVSLPYSVAVALLDGQALFAQYNDARLGETEVIRLTDLVNITVDDSLPRGVSCLMTMVMDDGSKFVSQIDYPKGSIQNSMSDDELRGKFDSLVIPVLGAKRAGEIAAAVASIESCQNVGELMKLTSKVGV